MWRTSLKVMSWKLTGLSENVPTLNSGWSESREIKENKLGRVLWDTLYKIILNVLWIAFITKESVGFPLFCAMEAFEEEVGGDDRMGQMFWQSEWYHHYPQQQQRDLYEIENVWMRRNLPHFGGTFKSMYPHAPHLGYNLVLKVSLLLLDANGEITTIIWTPQWKVK